MRDVVTVIELFILYVVGNIVFFLGDIYIDFRENFNLVFFFKGVFWG